MQRRWQVFAQAGCSFDVEAVLQQHHLGVRRREPGRWSEPTPLPVDLVPTSSQSHGGMSAARAYRPPVAIAGAMRAAVEVQATFADRRIFAAQQNARSNPARQRQGRKTADNRCR
jgi:hypothetical protein